MGRLCLVRDTLVKSGFKMRILDQRKFPVTFVAVNRGKKIIGFAETFDRVCSGKSGS